MSINVYKVCIPAIVFSILLSGCQSVSGSTESTNEIQALENEITQLKMEIELLQTNLAQVSNHLQETIESNPALKVNDLYNKAGLEDAVLELTEKNVLTFEELEFQVKALDKIDWSIFRSKVKDWVEFRFLKDYPYYTTRDLLSILRAYKNSDGSLSVDFAWLLYDLDQKFQTESNFLRLTNDEYSNTLDSFVDENGDVDLP